jgi:hypothetical protein
VWFVFSAPRRERPSERTFAAPLSLVGMRREYVITTPVPETVSVRLRGRLSDLRSLSSQTLEVPVDLAWVERSGTATITLHPQALNVPADVEVLSIEPNKFQFMVEGLRQAEVPIRPLIDGEVPRGYLAGDATADPAVALVSGPASQIRTFSEVRTERIIMTGRTATFTQSVDVVSESQLVRVISPLKTMVTVPILPPVGPPEPPADSTTTTTTTTGEPGPSTSTQ